MKKIQLSEWIDVGFGACRSSNRFRVQVTSSKFSSGVYWRFDCCMIEQTLPYRSQVGVKGITFVRTEQKAKCMATQMLMYMEEHWKE